MRDPLLFHLFGFGGVMGRVRNLLCQLFCLLAISVPLGTHAAAPNFNGGSTDVLFRNGLTGEVYAWLLTGTTVSAHGSMATVSPTWAIQGTGDINQDGNSDIVWRNTLSGEVFIWFTNGASVSSFVSLGTIASDWVIQAVGDINGDGRSDILWRNATSGELYVWFLSAAGGVSSQGSLGNAAADWKIQGLADTNNDARADIIWRNTTTGQVVVWAMNGLTVSAWGDVGSASAEWVIQAVADVNGGGNSDIIWRHTGSGEIYVWKLNGTALAAHGSVGVVSMDWTIHQAGDVNSDGRSDIFFRHTASGQIYIWLMNDLSISGQGSLGTVDHAWQIAPIRCWIGSACDLTMISQHNNVRTNGPFGPGNPAPSPALPNLVWNDASAVLAQSYASRCVFAHNSNRGGHGENLYTSAFPAGAGQPPAPSSATVVGNWAAEASDYTYSSNTCAAGQQCGHYTQIVWRNTSSVGCAVQYCTTNSPFGSSFPRWYNAVCNYAGPGNFSGQRPY